MGEPVKRMTVGMPLRFVEPLERAARSGGFHRVTVPDLVRQAVQEHLERRGYLEKEPVEVLTNP